MPAVDAISWNASSACSTVPRCLSLFATLPVRLAPPMMLAAALPRFAALNAAATASPIRFSAARFSTRGFASASDRGSVSTPKAIDPAYVPSSAEIDAANAELSEFWGETPSDEMEQESGEETSHSSASRSRPLHTQADIRRMQARINEQAAAAAQPQHPIHSANPSLPHHSSPIADPRSAVEAAAAAAAERAVMTSSAVVSSTTTTPAAVVVIHQHVHHHHYYSSADPPAPPSSAAAAAPAASQARPSGRR